MTPIRMERVETGVRTIIAFTDALNRHDLTAMLHLLSEDSTFEAPSPSPDGTYFQGKKAISEYWQGFLTRRPAVHIKIEESMGYGMRCIIRWRMEWFDSSGHTIHQRGVDLFRVQNSLITEHLSYTKG